MSDFPTEYRTKDVYIASTLIALGYNQYRIERNGKQCFFIFDTDEPGLSNEIARTGLEVTIDEYWSGNLKVDPKELFNSFKELKTRMYGEVNNE
jgi:hypothetical protein